ncbi:MAG: MFS transporter [Candidatus Caldatribacteriaceae bacterium]
MRRDRTRNIVITGLASLFTDVSSEMVYPIISLYLRALGGGPLTLGTIEGIAESTASLLKVFSGAIADWSGKRKPLTISGYALSLLGKILFYFAHSWQTVLSGRFADRFGKGIRTAPRDAMIAESAPEHAQGKAFGLHRALDTSGAVIGVLITYFFIARAQEKVASTSHLSVYLPTFRFIILLSLIPATLGVLILFLAIETGSGKRSLSGPSLHWPSFKNLDRKLQIFLIATLIFTLGNSSNQFILLRAAEPDVGFSPKNVTLLYLFYNGIYVLISYPAGHLSDKLGRKWILVLGFLLYSFSYALIGIFPRAILWTMIPYGLYIGMTEGISKALVAELSLPEEKATILGLHATLLGIGLFPASLLAGWLWNTWGPASPFLFGGSMSLLATAMLAFFL